MFVGHFAVALAAKRVSPRISLGTLFLAAQFLDLLWPVLLIAGVEHVRIDPGNTPMTPLDFYDYPISHSLLMAGVWSAVVGLLYFVVRKRMGGAGIVALAVFSHWILDFITHRPDLPLAPGSTEYLGLGLWHSIPASIIIEGAVFIAAIVVYVKGFPPIDRFGRWPFYLLMGFLALAWLSAVFGPPPPDTDTLAYSACILWLLIPWAYWIDRHRAHASINS